MSADFWAGYVSGAAGIIVGNPLDLIKTRLQAGQVHDAHPTSAASLRNTFDSAGTLVKGATAPILGYGALNAVLFVTYNRSLALLAGTNTNPNYVQIYVAGALGGLATFVVSTPTELIKVRTQLATELSRANGAVSRSSSFWIAKETWRREGLTGLYLGGSVTAWRDAVGYGFYFCAYDLSKKLMTSPNDPKAEHLAQWKIMLCGGIAGIVTWASIFPLDVIKTRIQSQSLASTTVSSPTGAVLASSPDAPSLGSPTSYGSIHGADNSGSRSSRLPQGASNESCTARRSARAITASMYRAKGLGVFFRGLGICSVRAFIVNAVQWAVYEWVMVFLSPAQRSQSS